MGAKVVHNFSLSRGRGIDFHHLLKLLGIGEKHEKRLVSLTSWSAINASDPYFA